MHDKLFALFEGDNSKYLKSSLTGEDDERGKKSAQYMTVHEPVTSDIWEKHLKGELRLGLKPEVGRVLMLIPIITKTIQKKNMLKLLKNINYLLYRLSRNLVAYIYLYSLMILLAQTKFLES